jgi:hypothetical protein
MGGRHTEGRQYIHPARETEAEEKIGLNSIHRGSCYRKPDKRPKKHIIQEQRRHTLKTQVIVERNSLQIIDIQEAKGGEHYCKVYKDPIGNGISNSIPLDADLGYLGIEE